MIKDFSTNLVLSNQYKQAFVNFKFDLNDYSKKPISFRVECSNISTNEIYVNGLDIAVLQSDPSYYQIPFSFKYFPVLNDIITTNSGPVVSFNVFSPLKIDKDFNLKIYAYNYLNASIDAYETNLNIYNRPSIYTNVNTYPVANIQNEFQSSYLVLRTNPKYTGNIKIVVDSSGNLYLDTFKIPNTALNNKKYRKQPIAAVSPVSKFSSDVTRVFKSLPEGDLHYVDANTLNISTPQVTFNNQYNTQYSYGARLFEDDLYTESYSILAPLWIGDNLPDYFAIFRVPGNYNPETYNTNPNLSDLFNNYLKNATLIKSWSLKDNSDLGIYLRKHLKEMQNTTSKAPVLISMSAEDNNQWAGISIGSNVISNKVENPYLFNQKTNFTDINQYISSGFESHNQIMADIINLEFAFDDEDASLYSMHRYFGLYLTENVLYNIAYYAETSTGPINILSLDGKDSSVFINSDIFDSSTFDIKSSYTDRIFELNGNLYESYRFTNKSEIDGTNRSFVSEFLNRPNNNILTTKVVQKNINPFITFTLNNDLNQGEHFRIINKTKNKIWEVYGIDSSLLLKGECWPYASETVKGIEYPVISQVPFSISGGKYNQIKAIKKAFELFYDYESVPFRVGISKYNTLSITLDPSTTDEFKFQIIRSNVRTNLNDPNSPFNTSGQPDDITLFGRYTPQDSEYQIISGDSSYGPINFELFGDRKSLTFDFIYQGNRYYYSYDASLSHLLVPYTLYQSESGWYNLLKSFDVSTSGYFGKYLYVTDPDSLELNDIIVTENPIKLINGIWNAYDLYPVNISLMGINSVKDFDFTVYDSSLGFKSEYWYARDNDVSTFIKHLDYGQSTYITERNGYIITTGTGTFYHKDSSSSYSGGFKFNTFDGSVYINALTPTDITYANITGNSSFNSYVTTTSEESVLSYYKNNSFLKYGLVIPTITKWVGIGTDCRNNRFRLILDSSIFKETQLQGYPTTNYIPYSDASVSVYVNEITYPSFKYLSPGDRNWQDYIYYDINDLIQCGSTLCTFRDLMFKEPTLDVFSKLIYSNSQDVVGIKDRSTLCYYNNYNNTLETLFLGLKYNIIIDNKYKSLFNLSDYNKYRFCFISTSSRNNTSYYPIEIIINENTKTILMIWYQGGDILNYSMRTSPTLPGHNLLFGDGSLAYLGFSDSSTYSYVKAPFVINGKTSTIIAYNTNSVETNYSPDICSSFAQLNYNSVTGVASTFNAPGTNHVSGSIFNYSYQYNTFTGENTYNYYPRNTTWGNNVVNWSVQYYSNKNNYVNNTTNLNTLKYIFANKYVAFSIIRGTTVYNNNNIQGSPIILSIVEPRYYKSSSTSTAILNYNGYYTPKFNNILEFSSNEDPELLNILKKDFILSNTKVKGYNNIPQLWYNKVVQTVTNITTGNSVSYVNGFNPCLSQWDKNYYTLFNESNYNNYTGISQNGYLASNEQPSFFGSKLIKLPSSIDITKWNYSSTTATVNENGSKINISLNLTLAIYDLFRFNSDFINNWNAFNAYGANVIDLINNYIKTTVINYYNINSESTKPTIYYKPFDGTRLYLSYDNSFVNKLSSYQGQLSKLNDNTFMYYIEFNKVPNYSYYITFNINEK